MEKLTTRCTYSPNLKLYTLIKKKICHKTREGLWKFSKISSSKSTLIHFHSFKGITMIQCYYPCFHHLLWLITLLFPRKVVGTNFQNFEIENDLWKKECQMMQIHVFKKKKKRRRRKTSNLVANGRFQD